MRKLAFVCGVLSVAFIVGTTLIGGATYPGYDHSTQYISELGAVGAPHQFAVNWFGFFVNGVFCTLFALFAYLSLPKSFASLPGFIGIMGYAGGMLAASFFPCDAGCSMDDPSLTQMVHTAAGGGGYVAGMIGLFFLGLAAKGWEGAKFLSALGFICGAVTFVSIGLIDPDFPYLGIAQRSLEAAMNIWILACSFYILTKKEA